MCVSMILVNGIVSSVLICLYDPTKRRLTRKRSVMELGQESELRIVACLHSQEDVSGINNIIKTLNPTISVQIDICLIHVIELVGHAHPIIMPHKLAKVKYKKVPGSKIIINAFKILQQSYEDGAIQLHPYIAISSYTTMHDEVYEMAATRRSSLIIYPPVSQDIY